MSPRHAHLWICWWSTLCSTLRCHAVSCGHIHCVHSPYRALLESVFTTSCSQPNRNTNVHDSSDNELTDCIAMNVLVCQVIAKQGEPAPRLCNKDPFALDSTVELSEMFPNAKFLLMIRDGRAVVHSIVSRKVAYVVLISCYYASIHVVSC